MDFSESAEQLQSEPIASAKKSSGGVPLHLGLLAGAVVLTSIGVHCYLKRSKLWGYANLSAKNNIIRIVALII